MTALTNVNSINYLDLIFSSRNKNYGAYALRVSYKKSLNIAMILTILISAISLSVPLLIKKKADVLMPHDRFITDLTLIEIYEGKRDEIKDLTSMLPKTSTATIKFTPPTVVPDESAVEDYMPTTDDLKDKAISDINREGIEGNNILPDELVSIPEKIVVEDNINEKYFSWVEEMPVYPKGEDEFLSFVASNIRYPEIARKAGIEGRVAIEFIVEKDGTLSDIQVVKGIGGGCDDEAVRVLKLSGKWIPGKQNGTHVKVKMTVPFIFKLN